ncbi:hypothetical protein KP509_35G054800 [Ceratopteris richardii]|nr:hypothetical protein KP509_35G054800 [Ceratopteris richardii]
MQVFRERLSKQQTGYIDKGMLANYRHNPDNEGSFILEDVSTMKKLEAEQLKESQLEAAVLSAPPMKVYSRPILTMAQEIVKVTEGSWSELHIVMSSLAPKAWKDGYSAATQQCILLMAMAEMTSCDTPPKVVISEAVELGKRFLDTRTAKIINECLGRFVRSEYFKQSQMKEDSVHE